MCVLVCLWCINFYILFRVRSKYHECIRNLWPKAAYKIEIPECKKPESKHLDSEVIKACLGPKQHPVNPHAQRLLTAEARDTAKVPKQSKTSKPNGKAGKRKSDKEKEEESGASRTTCSQQKKVFMAQEWLLVSKGWIQVDIKMYLFCVETFVVCLLALTLCFPKQTFAVRSAPSSSKALRIHPEEQREDV